MATVDKLIDITHVQVIGDHELRLTFEDGLVGDVAFGEHEWTGVFEPLRDPERFAKVAIDLGTIVWPQDGLDMAPEPLYQEASQHPVSSRPSNVAA
jgi:Protein of unknown function (DUF2442)